MLLLWGPTPKLAARALRVPTQVPFKQQLIDCRGDGVTARNMRRLRRQVLRQTEVLHAVTALYVEMGADYIHAERSSGALSTVASAWQGMTSSPRPVVLGTVVSDLTGAYLCKQRPTHLSTSSFVSCERP